MPELPEVETVVRSLAPRLTGRRIVEASFSSRFVVREDFGEMAAALAGRRIEGVERRGKFILVTLDAGALAIHLGMTGKLLLDAAVGPHARAVFTLDEGVLVYDDIRHFGRIEYSAGVPDRVAALGPDALTVPEGEFVAMVRRRASRIKPLLLNQAFLRGMGNIYTDEALFAAGIHPRAVGARLSKARVAGLHGAMTALLRLAIEHKGSSISDYVDGDGKRGSFQDFHRVYGRAGLACVVCGGAIRRILVAQRGTHYCPKCQRM